MLLGILCPEGGLFGPVTMRLAVIQAAEEAGMRTTHVLLPEEPADPEEIESALSRAGVDAVVVLNWTVGINSLLEVIRHRRPTAVVSGAPLAPEDFGVQFSQRQAGIDVVNHLRAQGCERIAHFSGPSNWIDAIERKMGWQEATVGLDGCTLVETHSWGSQSAYDAARDLLGEGWRPDAVFAANDLIALGVMKALNEFGVSIPKDVAVAGFDSIAGSESFIPPLTSVTVPFAEAGLATISVLEQAMSGGVGGVVSYRPKLMARESTLRQGLGD